MKKTNLTLIKNKAIAGSSIGYLITLIVITFIFLSIFSGGMVRTLSVLFLMVIFIILIARNRDFKELKATLSGICIKWK